MWNKKFANSVLYQAAWLGIVMAWVSDHVWLGLAVTAVALCVHFVWVSEDQRTDVLNIFFVLCVAIVLESANLWWGLYGVGGVGGQTLVDAPWLLLLWAVFATTLGYGLSGLQKHLFWAALLGGIGGPMAFWAGSRWGVLTLSNTHVAKILLAVEWAVCVPVMLWMHQRIARQSLRLSVGVVLVWLSIFAPVYAEAAENSPSLQEWCLTHENNSLQSRGRASYRFMRFIDVFDAEFFDVPQNRQQSPLSSTPKCLVIRYKRAFESEQFWEATIQGILQNVGPVQFEKLRPKIEQFNAFYRDVSPGDCYSITYTPHAGTVLAYNGTPRGNIPGHDFAAALFSIWLGDKSMDGGLRRKLLGGG
jgi:hypothetical protein